jgi:hypothetical protein
MKAAVYYENGGPEVLKYEEVPDPKCAADGVVVDVEVISLEGGDTLHGAEVLTTASSDEKLARLREFGASHASSRSPTLPPRTPMSRGGRPSGASGFCRRVSSQRPVLGAFRSAGNARKEQNPLFTGRAAVASTRRSPATVSRRTEHWDAASRSRPSLPTIAR